VKILVRATNWLGDAVLSLPAIRALRGANPQSEVVVLARPWVAALYEGERSIDRVIPLTAASGARDWLAKWKLGVQLRQERFDLAVLLPNSFESAAIVWLSGARRRVGYARDARGFLLTDAIEVPRPGEIPPHERYYYPELLRRAGLIEKLPEIQEILFCGLGESRARGEALFKARGIELPVIGVNPGAAFGTAKRWLPERFAEVARHLARAHSASIAVFGAEAERELCGQVATAAGGNNLAGATTLREFIDMPVSPHAQVLRQPVDCAPCGLRECPIDHRCMTRVTVDRVLAAAEIKESQP